jgi:hypothetical protein
MGTVSHVPADVSTEVARAGGDSETIEDGAAPAACASGMAAKAMRRNPETTAACHHARCERDRLLGALVTMKR